MIDVVELRYVDSVVAVQAVAWIDEIEQHTCSIWGQSGR